MEKVFPKVRSLVQLYELLPENERVITDVLRQIVKDNLPAYCKEKISYNVPYFYGKKGICIIWPATVPREGIKKGHSRTQITILHMVLTNRYFIKFSIYRTK